MGSLVLDQLGDQLAKLSGERDTKRHPRLVLPQLQRAVSNVCFVELEHVCRALPGEVSEINRVLERLAGLGFDRLELFIGDIVCAARFLVAPYAGGSQ